MAPFNAGVMVVFAINRPCSNYRTAKVDWRPAASACGCSWLIAAPHASGFPPEQHKDDNDDKTKGRRGCQDLHAATQSHCTEGHGVSGGVSSSCHWTEGLHPGQEDKTVAGTHTEIHKQVYTQTHTYTQYKKVSRMLFYCHPNLGKKLIYWLSVV